MRQLFFLIFIVSGFTTFGQKFIEVSNSKGLDYYFPGHHRQEVGAGITVVDINNDGWDDIFQACGNFASKVWINHEGTFADETDIYLPDSIKYRHIQAAIAGDYDNDGYEDLILTNMSFYEGDNKTPVMLKNVDGKHFIQVFEEVFSEQGNYPSATWGDINNDGFLDLFILNYVRNMKTEYDSLDNFKYIPDCLPNKFFVNQNGQKFIDRSEELGLNDQGCGLACMFTDFDNDADVDLLMLNDFGEWNHKGNRIYRNEYPKEKFTDISIVSKFYGEFYGMGIGAGDFDYDGDLDYYFTNIGNNSLVENCDGSFKEVAGALGLSMGYNEGKKSTSWSGLFFDVENDGDLDLFVTKGYLESLEKPTVYDNNRLMVNKRNKFVDRSNKAGISDNIPNRGAAFLDFDHDGDLDIVVNTLELGRSEFAGIDQKIKLYENVSKSKNHWIGIKLQGTDGVNRSAIGCSVRFKINDKWFVREVDGGSGHSSQSSRVLYFGLGKQQSISDIQINWIGGSRTTITMLEADKCYLISQNGEIDILY